MEKKKVPALRFRGFHDDWEQRKLGELIIEYKENVDSSCTLPVLTSSKTEGVILQEEHFGRKQQHDITGYNVLPRSFCTYRNRSDGVDFTFNVNECCDMGIISKFYPVFSGNDNDTYFISLVLNNSDEVVHEIAYTCTGTGQKVLSFLDLQKMSIRVPQHSEQKKISAYFKQLDHLITLHQRKYEKLQKLKKAMLEKMFPKPGCSVPEIRFQGFTDDWEQCKLGELSSVSMCRRIFKEQTTESGDIPFYKIGTFGAIADAFISKELFEEYKSKYPYPRKGDILISASGSIGRTVEFTGENEYFQDSNIVWLNHDERLSDSFLKCFYAVVKWAGIEGSTIKRLYNDNILNTPISVPSISEQEKIGSFFVYLDHLITLHQRKLEKLKNLKKACLEKMFA